MSPSTLGATSVVSTFVVPSLTDPFGAAVALGGVGMAALMLFAASALGPRRDAARSGAARPADEPRRTDADHLGAQVAPSRESAA